MNQVTRSFALSVWLTLVTACAPSQSTSGPRTISVAIPVPTVPIAGTDKVLGKDARGLVAMFGAAEQDVTEANARKLQFVGTNCIVDAYLYPPARGKEPVVTYIDARLHDGRDTDRARCVAALLKQK